MFFIINAVIYYQKDTYKFLKVFDLVWNDVLDEISVFEAYKFNVLYAV